MLEAVDSALARQPHDIRIPGFRFFPNEINVAVVVPGEGDLREDLDKYVPGPDPVMHRVRTALSTSRLEVAFTFCNERTWRDVNSEAGWHLLGGRSAVSEPVVRTARPFDAEDYGAASELPPAGQMYVARQQRIFGLQSPMEAAQWYRKICVEQSWLFLPYQLVRHDGKAFWWNTGWGVTEEWLLMKETDPGTYIVHWDTVVEWEDEESSMRVVGARLKSEAASGEMDLTVIDSQGRKHRLRPSN